MRILLFGDISGVAQLLRHLPSEHVIGVVGAGIRPQYHEPLSSIATQLNVPFITQPKRLSGAYGEFQGQVAALRPDLIWVNSYSMVVHEDILSLARLGGINIHGALLPRYRGCHPIQWAIINGETETGVTLHRMTAGLDEGPIIDQQRIPLLFEDTWKTARDRIEAAGDELIAANLPAVLMGKFTAKVQDEESASYGHRRTPDDGLFDWKQPVINIYNKVRALLPPLPPAFFVDADGCRVCLDRYHTPAQVAALKYGPAGGARMETGHVRLRPLRRDDAKLLYEWITHRELVILNAPFHPASALDREAWMESILTKRTDVVVFVIEETASGKAIGTCQLLNVNWRHRSAELQIRIGEASSRSRGYGTEAIELLCLFGFAELNLHRIYLHVFKTNVQAMRAGEKCGFAQEAVLKEAAFIDGNWHDVVRMGLIDNNG